VSAQMVSGSPKIGNTCLPATAISVKTDYQYGKRRLRQIDGRIRFLTKRIEAAEVVQERRPS
jgi:transcription elongation GreA/GreB family factor